MCSVSKLHRFVSAVTLEERMFQVRDYVHAERPRSAKFAHRKSLAAGQLVGLVGSGDNQDIRTHVNHLDQTPRGRRVKRNPVEEPPDRPR